MTTENQVALARQGRGASSHLSKAARKVVPAFLQKLYEMVNDPGSDELIRWSEAGDSLYVLDHERLAHEVLGRWFKHGRFSSFVRQLNMYGFHKIPHLQQGVLKSDTDTELWNFEHPHFRRGQPDMLCLIQRKKQLGGNNTLPEEHPIVPPRDPVNPNLPPLLQNIPTGQVLDVNSLVTGISAIKRHQQAISDDLNELKSSNQHLWQEAMAARERHKKHQDTINRILKFLAGVFGHSADSPVRKHDGSESPHSVVPRKRQRLMIADASSEKSRGVSVADEADEDDLMDGLETGSQTRTPTPFATIATPSELFSPASETITALPPQITNDQLQNGPTPPLSPSALTSFTSNRAGSPNTNDLLQSALSQMMNSPQQMQRLLQALSQSNFPIQPQPSPPVMSTSADTESNNQLTQYAPPTFNVDTLLHQEDINPGCAILLPLTQSQQSSPQPSSALAPSKADDLIPLFQDHDLQLQKSWNDTSHIAANVDLMDSNIKTFIDDLGFDPSMFDQPEFTNKLPVGNAEGAGSNVVDATGGSNGEATGDIDLDFEDLLTQFSRQNEDETSYGHLGRQLASSAAVENGETDQLTAFLDEVASDTASIRQHSPEAPLLGRKKRKSDVADILDNTSSTSPKVRRSK